MPKVSTTVSFYLSLFFTFFFYDSYPRCLFPPDTTLSFHRQSWSRFQSRSDSHTESHLDHSDHRSTSSTNGYQSSRTSVTVDRTGTFHQGNILSHVIVGGQDEENSHEHEKGSDGDSWTAVTSDFVPATATTPALQRGPPPMGLESELQESFESTFSLNIRSMVDATTAAAEQDIGTRDSAFGTAALASLESAVQDAVARIHRQSLTRRPVTENAEPGTRQLGRGSSGEQAVDDYPPKATADTVGNYTGCNDENYTEVVSEEDRRLSHDKSQGVGEVLTLPHRQTNNIESVGRNKTHVSQMLSTVFVSSIQHDPSLASLSQHAQLRLKAVKVAIYGYDEVRGRGRERGTGGR